jgi:hypothetical protein
VKEIHLQVDGGLCNRIAPILSALFMARKLGATITFHWGLGAGCTCTAEKLFVPTLAWAVTTGNHFRYDPRDPQSRTGFRLRLRTRRTLRLKSSVFFEDFHTRYPAEALTWITGNLSRYFVPIPLLERKITHFASRFDPAQTLALHVRRGDMLFRGRQIPTLGQYLAAIDEILPRFSQIFLATDDGHDEQDSLVIRALKTRYGRALLYRPKRSIRRDEAGIQDALVDLWLLRRCPFLIGTTHSTYSLVAALGRPALILRRNGTDLNLPSPAPQPS